MRKVSLLTFLGRFFQDSTEWSLSDLTPRLVKNIDKIKPLLARLEKDGYIEIIDKENVVFKIIKAPPKNEKYL